MPLPRTTATPHSFVMTLVGIIALYTILYYAQSLLLPILLSVLLSFSIQPIVARLERLQIRKRHILGKSGAILISILGVLGVLAGLITLSGVQITNLVKDLPALSEKFNQLLANIQDLVFKYAGVTPEEQFGMISSSLSQVFSTGASVAGVALGAASNMFFYVSMVPIYMYLMLYYAPVFENFVIEVSAGNEQKELTRTIVNKIGHVVQQYISSLSTVIVIVAILNSVGMLLLGINYAIFFGVLISMLAIIPYFGIMIGAGLAAIYTLLTTDSLWYPIGVLLINAVVQFLEGNFITPYIMGSRLQLNPLIVMVFLFLGSFVWGAMGMILSVPILAITKMVCDQIEVLQPYGRLLGGEVAAE